MDINVISQYFKLDHDATGTTGIGNGVIIKFKTFYLKIYDDIRNNHYNVEGYEYSISIPVKKWEIPYNRLKKFARSIKSDNFLSDNINDSLYM
jgi:hypothetical protein